MPVWPIMLVMAGSFALSVAIVWGFMRFGWNDLARKYPQRPAAPDAVARNFQSFRMDLINLGFAVHVAADERYLHLMPIRPLRWLGARPASIPWDAVTLRRRGKLWCSARIGKHALQGPVWCLGLADPTDGAGP